MKFFIVVKGTSTLSQGAVCNDQFEGTHFVRRKRKQEAGGNCHSEQQCKI